MFITVFSEETAADKQQKVDRLLKKLTGKDMNVLEELYNLIKTDIYAFALSKTGNKTDAEDILEDTFVQIYKHCDQYNSQGKPMSWVLTIAANLINKRYIKASRYTELNEDIDSDENPQSCDDFSDQVIENEFLRGLMSTLSSEEQQIVTLHVVSGLKHKEIGTLLDLPLSTVLSKYNRAIKKLQTLAKEDM